MSKSDHGFYQGLTIQFATKHHKDSVLKPLLAPLRLGCEALGVDTDLFGTFSGEIERTGTVRETLRKKIAAAVKIRPHERLFLASEGSFGPHPLLGWVATDLESLLFFDRELDLEIHAEYLDTSPMHFERVLGPGDDVLALLRGFGFPEHGVLVCPEKSGLALRGESIHKGLHCGRGVEQAIRESFLVSATGRVVLASDLRAHHNPRRREAIRMAGEKLVEKLASHCPVCGVPGFAIVRGEPGLPCSVCGEASAAARAVVWECVRCHHSETRARPDGKRTVEPSECEQCNP